MDNNTKVQCSNELISAQGSQLSQILRTKKKLVLELSVFLVLMYIILFYLKTWKSRSPTTLTSLPNLDIGIEDLLDLTDTEDSTSSSSHQVYEGHRPFVLELHELKRDDPANPQSEADKKKKKKKKSKLASNRSNTSATSSSMSESSIPPTVADAVAKEQFYDAHESFHGLTETSSSSRMNSDNIIHLQHFPGTSCVVKLLDEKLGSSTEAVQSTIKTMRHTK